MFSWFVHYYYKLVLTTPTFTPRPQIHTIGLDPAGPLYQDDIRRGLNSDSGSFVDVIHTDGWLMGTMNRLGHVDFYPNRGNEQAGCEG